MTLFIAWGQQVMRHDKPQPPGNSLPIIDLAYELGYDGIELDLQLSKDGVLVLMHDHTVDRTTYAKGKVTDLTLEELRKIQIRDEWNGPPCFIPTFEEALKVNGDRGPVMCDLRQIDSGTIPALHDAVDRADFDSSKLLFIAYTKVGGVALKEAFPRSTVMLKAPINLKPPALTVDFINEADGIEAILVPSADYPELTAQFKAEADRRGMKVAVYLQHRGLPSLLEILESGVDFVTTVSHQHFDAARRRFPRPDVLAMLQQASFDCPSGTMLARSTLREICAHAMPGLMHFGRDVNRLSVAVAQDVSELSLSIPEYQILNLSSVEIETVGNAPLPPYSAKISSTFSEQDADAARLLQGKHLHTKREHMPRWQASFASPVPVRALHVANRLGKWGVRNYGLCVEWTGADGVTHAFDNLGAENLLRRLRAAGVEFRAAESAFARRLPSEAHAARTDLQRLSDEVAAHLSAIEAVLRKQAPVNPRSLFEGRQRVLAAFNRCADSLSGKALTCFAGFTLFMDRFLWKGGERQELQSAAEAKTAAYLLAIEYEKFGVVSRSAFFEFGSLVDTDRKVIAMEAEVERIVRRMRPDFAEFPLSFRMRGLRGAGLRANEARYTEAMRDVMRLLEEIGRPAAICHSTLLGAVREGRFLAHDDNVDLICLTNGNSVTDAHRDLREILAALQARDIKASLTQGHPLLTIWSPRTSLPVDLFAAFHAHPGKCLIHQRNGTFGEIDADVLVPFSTMTFYGEPVRVPATPERFLEARYGANWRVPNRFHGIGEIEIAQTAPTAKT